jgi:NAD(P)-dependent dehydrogenase (short-subunit alcohol dehydrogenase family)
MRRLPVRSRHGWLAGQQLGRRIAPESFTSTEATVSRESARDVAVIIGLGHLGRAVAHRLGSDYRLVVADSDQQVVEDTAGELGRAGIDARAALVDVSDYESVRGLAALAKALGEFRAVVRTESRPPSEMTADEIIAEGVVGTANILDAFGRIARPGSVAVCVAGIAGTLADLSKKDERALARTPAPKLTRVRAFDAADRDKDAAYAFAQRAIHLRAEAASIDWGIRGGRTVSISPGAIAHDESEPALLGLSDDVRSVILESPEDFVGTVDDVAEAVAFAIGDDASYVTGADLRVDGGLVSAARWSRGQTRSSDSPVAPVERASCAQKQPTPTGASREVVVITGCGGMGAAIARRLGADYTLVLADYRQEALDSACEELRQVGCEVHPAQVDVSDQVAVRELAEAADSLGRFRAVVHTAGLSPVQASTEQIVAVDLMGTAYVLDEFGKIARPGSVALCIASQSAYMTSFPPDIEEQLATAPVSELRDLPVFDPAQVSPQAAYPKAKLANKLRVEAAANEWRKRGGRTASVGPGIILTPMGQEELVGRNGTIIRAMIAMSAARRAGEPEEVAGVVAFLLSDRASFVSGTDLLMDGGFIAWMKTVRRGGFGVVPRMLGRRLRAKLLP